MATVRLWAYDDTGQELARSTVRLMPWARMAGPPESWFPTPAAGATQLRYDSDRQLVGFALSDSPDKTAFSVLAAAPEYLR